MTKKKMEKIDLESFFLHASDPNHVYGASSENDDEQKHEKTIENSEQKLSVRKEKKGRGGKVVTIISGYQGSLTQLEDLAKEIKQYCGTGGSVKDAEIVIQGDRAQQLVDFLNRRGYSAKKTTM